MSNRWFTADTHFFHANILKHEARPWATVEEMNEALVERWNERVRPNDLVYHLGDVTFGKKEESYALLKRLRGQKHLIRGNHDGVIECTAQEGFDRLRIFENSCPFPDRPDKEAVNALVVKTMEWYLR